MFAFLTFHSKKKYVRERITDSRREKKQNSLLRPVISPCDFSLLTIKYNSYKTAVPLGKS